MKRHTHLTLATTFIGGTLAGSFAGWLLVPAMLPVTYLTPIVVWSTFAGCVLGAVLCRLQKQMPEMPCDVTATGSPGNGTA